MPPTSEIFYNLWGDTPGGINQTKPECFRHSANLKAFEKAAEEKFIAVRMAIDTGCRYEDLVDSIVNWLESLYADYLDRIAQTKTPEIIRNLVKKWSETTGEVFADIIEPLISEEHIPERQWQAYISVMEKIEGLMDAICTDLEFDIVNGRFMSRHELKDEKITKSNKKSIEDLITDQSKITETMALLHRYFDGKGNKELAIMVQAAIKSGILVRRPSHEMLKSSFDISGSKGPFYEAFSLINEEDYKGLLQLFSL